jgi:hypothetical protein
MNEYRLFALNSVYQSKLDNRVSDIQYIKIILTDYKVDSAKAQKQLASPVTLMQV